MRKSLLALVVLGLVWISYAAWPLYELTVLVRAIDARDLSTLVWHINFDRVRVSVTEQMVTAYIGTAGSCGRCVCVASGRRLTLPFLNVAD
jgi:Protein of unknown function (DUF2939)